MPFTARPARGLDAVAYDVWTLRRDALRHRLQRAGVAVVEWDTSAPLQASWRRCGHSGATPGTRAPDHRRRRARGARGGGRLRAANGGRFAGVALGATVLAFALLALGLVLRWPTTIPWAIVIAAAGYIVTREGKDVVDGWAAVVGVLLLLAAELAAWSIDHDARIRSEPSLLVRRVADARVLAAAALLVNFVLLAAAAVSASAGVLIAAVGVAAAVTAVAVVLRLVRA